MRHSHVSNAEQNRLAGWSNSLVEATRKLSCVVNVRSLHRLLLCWCEINTERSIMRSFEIAIMQHLTALDHIFQPSERGFTTLHVIYKQEHAQRTE